MLKTKKNITINNIFLIQINMGSNFLYSIMPLIKIEILNVMQILKLL